MIFRINIIARLSFGLLLIIIVVGCGATQQNEESQDITIGVLSGAPLFDTAIDGFKTGMAELGYVEGENVTYDIQSANGDNDLMQSISEQFVTDGVDLIFTTTNNAAIAARAATTESGIPVVFTFVIAPVESGVVDDLRNPGGNVTGVRNPLDDFVGRRVELLLRIDETATRLWTPYDPRYPTVTTVLARLNDFAPDMGFEVVETIVSSPDEVIASIAEFNDMEELPFDAILIFPDLTVQLADSWAVILEFATENDLPVLANSPGQVNDGALFSYLIDNVATGEQAARMAAQILGASSPEELPIETAELSLMLNLVSADAMGLNVPTHVISSAQVVIRDTDSDE